MTLLVESNPVPDVAALDLSGDLPNTRLFEYDARSKEMTKFEIDKSDSTPVPRGRRVIIGALAVVGVVALGILILPRMRDGAPVAGAPATPVETATAFLEAYLGRFDVDEAFSYLAADPEAVGIDNEGAANYHQLARFFEATGSKLVDLQCEEVSASAEGTMVRCAYESHGFFSDELGLGPYGPDGFEFTVVNEEIVAVKDADPDTANTALSYGPFSDQIWEPFADWIGENHPDDRAVMYDPYPTDWRITEESIPVWEQRLREYVAEVTGQAAEDTTIGLPGLPPEGATPSTPENGELVASMWEHIGAPGSFGNGWLYLYADGRLIWEQLDPNPTGGWLEQRLTPEGVELIRSEIIATGLFDSGQPTLEPNGGFPRGVNGGSIQVRNGDQLVYVNRVEPELFGRLAELWSWLPDGAWEDKGPKPYVPSRYAVCVHSGGYAAPTGASDHLSALPAAARDLLASARQLQMNSLVDVDPAGFAFAEGSTEYCYDIATEEARTLAVILDEAGSEELPHRWYDGSEVTYVISTGLEDFSGVGFNGVTLMLWPMLPHGVPALTGA
jgi:hypothetical protein